MRIAELAAEGPVTSSHCKIEDVFNWACCEHTSLQAVDGDMFALCFVAFGDDGRGVAACTLY